jgi:predicted double-glycine peptidase
MSNALFLLLSTALLSQETVRFAHVFKQGFDTSCGISVTASLLDKYWNMPVQEAALYQAMLEGRIGEGGQTYTINFLTIQEYLQHQDIQSKAYYMDGLLGRYPGKRFRAAPH